MGPRTWAEITRDSWSTPWKIGPNLRRPGQLIDTTGRGTGARLSRESWSNPRELRHWPESTRRASRTRGPSDTCTSHPGQLVNPGRPSVRARARVARDSWLTTQAVRLVPKTPGRAGRPRGPSDPIASHPVHLVEPMGLRTQARLSRESLLTLWALEPHRESPGRAGQHHGPLDPGCGHPGQLVDPVGPHAWAQA